MMVVVSEIVVVFAAWTIKMSRVASRVIMRRPGLETARAERAGGGGGEHPGKEQRSSRACSIE